MAICAERMIADGLLRKNTVAATVMSNLGLERAIERLGGTLVRTAVGDRYVVEAMRKHDCNLGGEQSGHLIFIDHASTGDGIVAALQVAAIMMRTGLPLSELARRAMVHVPQVLENATLADAPTRARRDEGPRVRHREGEEGARRSRVGSSSGWSGTEPKLRVMIEGPGRGRRSASWARGAGRGREEGHGRIVRCGGEPLAVGRADQRRRRGAGAVALDLAGRPRRPPQRMALLSLPRFPRSWVRRRSTSGG